MFASSVAVTLSTPAGRPAKPMLVLMLALAMAAPGCGQKGPLTLPGPAKAASAGKA